MKIANVQLQGSWHVYFPSSLRNKSIDESLWWWRWDITCLETFSEVPDRSFFSTLVIVNRSFLYLWKFKKKSLNLVKSVATKLRVFKKKKNFRRTMFVLNFRLAYTRSQRFIHEILEMFKKKFRAWWKNALTGMQV